MDTEQHEKAVVLLSGGLDSTTVLHIATKRHPKILCVAYEYGQRHAAAELACAQYQALRLGVSLSCFSLPTLLGSSLTDRGTRPDKDQDPMRPGVPSTFVPGRNMVFLSHAAAFAASQGAWHLYIGANVLDYSGYPDCRPGFIDHMEHTVNWALGEELVRPRRFKIHAPLIMMSKSEIIKVGHQLDVDYSMTHSCYDPVQGKACGRCDSCQLRRKGFEDAKIADPTVYT